MSARWLSVAGWVGVALVSGLALSACAGRANVDPNLDVWSAKAAARRTAQEIVDVIPRGGVIRVVPRPYGSLLSCRGDRNYRWAGGTDIEMRDGVDFPAVLDVISQHFAAKGFVSRDLSRDDRPRIQLLGVYGSSYLVGLDSESSAYIDAFSPCFHLPEGQSPHGFF